MPRSPMLRRVQRWLARAVDANRRGVPVDEALARPTRRALLQGTAAALIAPRVVGCADAAPAGVDAPVVVIGAGLAGLTAAWRLERLGLRVECYDAGTRVGGRTLTARMTGLPTKGELGAEYVDTGHAALRGLVQELGLHLTDVRDATLSENVLFLGGRRWTSVEILREFAPVAAALMPELDALGDAQPTYQSASPDAQRLDRLSIAAWFDQHGLGGVSRTLVESAYRGEFGRDAGDLSLLDMLTLLGGGASPANLLGDSDQAYTIAEGSDAVATSIASRLTRPVTPGHALVAVRTRSDGRFTVVLDRGGATVERSAESVVLAIPFTQLRRCELGFTMPAAQRAAIATLQYGQNAKVLLGMSSRPWRAAREAGTSVCDEVFSESWDSAAGLSGDGAVMTAFSGGALGLAAAQGDAAAQGARAVAQLERVFPGVMAAYNGTAARMAWAAAPRFEGSYACYAPGQWTTLRGAEGLAAGRVHFAGEHTSTEFQGFMNGAVESGERAAREVARDFGR